MADPSANYRAKYLQALKEQERIDKQHAFQLDLLKKALARLSVAASGLDANLDSSLERLRETMRGASGAQVFEQIERVQKAVDGFEVNRNKENARAAQHMAALTDQYQKLQIPSDLKSSLKDFNKRLTKRLETYRQYPAALEDLAKLQQLALDAASEQNPSFWRRLKGGKTVKLEGEQAPAKTKAPTKENAEQERLDQGAEEVFELHDVQNTKTDDRDKPTKPLNNIGIQDSEDSYDQVAARIASTLENLVEKIQPNALIKHKVDIVRHRIERGMDWFALAVTLEDIRDILFLRYLQADEEFSDYLNQVKGELKSIREALSGAESADIAQNKAADLFSDTVSTQVGKIRDSIAATHKIDELKSEVTDHISFIHDALNEFRKSRGAESSLADQLKALVTHVQSIETESQKTKELLAEQRHKATHDALTELPNREAYNERAFHELQRFKRYNRPLTIAVCDIDFFKKINDGYGHQAGDKVLKLIAKLISTRLRTVDFAARYGGEEFVILMPETGTEQARSVLDKIRRVIGKTPFRFKENPVQITISFGIASFQSEDTIESAFAKADKALYAAKEQGRNRCVIDGAEN